MRRFVLLAATLTVVSAPAADASQLIDRNASAVTLAVNAEGEALLTYRAGGESKRVLARGAVNAIAPAHGKQQVEFKLDYSGGSGTFGGSCGGYDGPALAWKVTACKAPDGSFWALQAWQRALPNYGLVPSPVQAVWELRLSHWTGETAELTIKTDWAYRRFDHLYGSLTYRDGGVFGFRSTRFGVPLDAFGRNVYVDTFDSAYGPGWKRENSFLTHRRGGTFCYGFYPHGSRPAGRGAKYRATVIGPGVTPDVLWEGPGAGAYDRAADQAANEEQRGAYRDGVCKVN